MAKKKKVVRTRRRERKNVAVGHAHVLATFNNTIVSLTDPSGNVIAWGSAGGQGFKAADLKGKVTLVNFFASWCGPCRVEHPMLPLIAKAGIELIGIDYKDRPEDAKAWLAELGDPYRTVAVDAKGQTGLEFGVYGVPESYLIDKKGVIRYKQTGPLTPEIIRNRLIPMAEKLAK